MSVIVKGMKMPKKCEQCWFFGTDSARVGYCYLMKGELPLPDGIPQDCPLIELPLHGDLIDRDALMKKLNNCMFPSDMVTIRAVSMAMNWLKESPTVIESEET